MIARKAGMSGDAREQGIYPTKKAEKIAVNLEQTGNELYQEMLKSIGDSELKSLVNDLREAKDRVS